MRASESENINVDMYMKKNRFGLPWKFFFHETKQKKKTATANQQSFSFQINSRRRTERIISKRLVENFSPVFSWFVSSVISGN